MTTRRSFLKTATVSTAGALILPTILPSCIKWKGANDRINVGHIGVGSRGMAEMKMYVLPFDQFRINAVCDVFLSRRESAAQVVSKKYESDGLKNPSCDSYNDYRELLDRRDIDMVAITSPDHWHLPIAIHAVQAGKHVHVNKPLGLNYLYMLELKEELENQKLKFNYGTQQRSYAFLKKAMEVVRNGGLGEIKKAIVWAPGGGTDRHIGYFKPMNVPVGLDYDMWLGPAPKSPYTADRVHRDGSFFINDYSIGFLGGWGAHPLDVLVWALKDQLTTNCTVKATGEIRWPESSMYNNINVWDAKLKYENGPEVRFLSQDLAKPVVMEYLSEYRQNGTLFIGSKAWMSLSRTYAESDNPEINQAINDFPKKDFGLDGDRGTHLLEFASLIRGDSESYMSVDDAILSDTISHLTNVAIRQKQEITWDAVAGKLKNSPEGNKLMNREHRQPY